MKPSQAIRKGLDYPGVEEHHDYYLQHVSLMDDKYDVDQLEDTTVYAACALGCMWLGAGYLPQNFSNTSFFTILHQAFPELNKTIQLISEGRVLYEGEASDVINYIHRDLGWSAETIADWLEKEHNL